MPPLGDYPRLSSDASPNYPDGRRFSCVEAFPEKQKVAAASAFTRIACIEPLAQHSPNGHDARVHHRRFRKCRRTTNSDTE
jgi:hypothetical protein